MHTVSVRSRSRSEFVDITQKVQGIVAESGLREGFCVVYVPHTTAAVTINEGADPSVQSDILGYLSERVPHRGPYKHMEGNSDAHIKSSMLGASATIIVQEGKLVLGTWQSIFFCEFDGPRNRRVHIQMVG